MNHGAASSWHVCHSFAHIVANRNDRAGVATRAQQGCELLSNATAVRQDQPAFRLRILCRLLGWIFNFNIWSTREKKRVPRLCRRVGIGDRTYLTESGALQKLQPLSSRKQRRLLPQLGVFKFPPALSQAKNEMSESRGLVQFEQKEKSIRGKEALDVPERLPQIARSVQRIGGENQIELVRLEALRIG